MPLAAILVVGGVVLVICSVIAPITSPFPFVRSERLNRVIFGMLSIYCIGMGIGLLFRSRIAWCGLLASMGVAAVLPVLTPWDERIFERNGYWPAIVGVLLNGVAGVGIYYAIRPVFDSRKQQ